jgi:large subunit ribosomal protein L21
LKLEETHNALWEGISLSDKKLLSGRVAVVAGGGGEIGGAIALRYAAEGADVVVGAPTVEGAAVTGTLIETRKGVKIKIFKKIRRQGYRRTGGHRQIESVVRVTGLAGAGLTQTWDGTVDMTPRAILNAKARGLTNLVAELEAAHAPVVAAPTADAAPAKKPRAKKAAPAADASEGAEA